MPSARLPAGPDTHAGPAETWPSALGVQPFGVLLVLCNDATVAQCGTNAAGLFGRPLDDILGRPVADLVPPAVADWAAGSLVAGPPGVVRPVGSFTPAGGPAWRVLGHHRDGVRLIEFVPDPADTPPLPDLGPVAVLLADAPPLPDFARAVCEHFRAATGYDRVIAVRFDPGGGGRVVAETRADDLPLLADWPAPVWEDAARVWAVADADADPVPLTAQVNPATGRELDVSCAVTRPVPPTFRESLRAAGATAALAAPVRHDGRPWGFVVGLHRGPRVPRPGWIERADSLARLLAAAVRLDAGRPAADPLRPHPGTLIDQVHDAVIVTDTDGVVTYWNDGAARTLGWAAAEMVGRHVFDRIPPADRPGAAAILADVQAGEPFAGRYRDTRKDGRPVWLDVRLHGIHDEAGRFVGVMGEFRDVTAEKLAEDQLRLQQAIVHQSRDNILVTEAEPTTHPGPRIVYANPALLANTGYALEELVGRTPRVFQGPKTDRAVLDRIRAALQAWQSVREEVVNYRKDGSEFWVELDITPLADETGWYTHWISIQRDITERKQAEAVLRAQEAQFRALAECLPDPVLVVAPDDPTVPRRILYSNPAVTRTYGYAPADLIGTSLNSLLAAADWPHVPVRMARLMAGEPLTFEVTHLGRDGRPVPMEVRAARIDWAGRPAVLAVCRDLSDRRRAEAELRASEARFRALAEQCPDPVFVLDPDDPAVPLRILYANEVVKRTHGYDPGDLVGRPITAIDDPASAAAAPWRLARLMAGGPLTFEVTHLGRDGRRLDYEVRAARIDWSGRRAVLSINRDLTDRRRAEAALRAGEERLSAVIRHTPNVAIQWYDADGRVLLWNEASEAMFGYPAADAVGRTLDQLIHTREEAAAFRDALADIARTGTPVGPAEFRFRRRDGRPGVCLSSVFPIPGEGGRPWFVCMDVDMTERVAAEEALRASESFLRAVFDATPECVKIVDADGTLLRMNRAGLRMIGFDEAAAVGRCVFDLVAREDRDRYVECHRRVVGGTAEALRFDIIRPDGRRRSLESYAVPFDLDGRRVHLAMTRDITDRKRAEEALRESEERLQLALSAGRMGTFDWDMVTDRIVWSRSHYDVFGYDPDAPFPVEFRHFADRLHPDDRAAVERRLAAARDARVEYAHECRILLPDGTVRWVAGRGRFYYGPDGRAARMVGITQDVTNRKEHELKLREMTERYRLLADHSADVVTLHDPAGRYLYVSPSSVRLSGYRPEDLVGRDSGPDIHPDDLPAVTGANVANHLGETTNVEWRLRRVDGAYVWVESAAKPITNPDGTVQAIVVSTRDISRRKALEDQVRQAQKLEAIGRLAGGVAHDFNNLLTVVSGNAELLLADTPPGHPHRALLAGVLRAGGRGAALTRQLLAFSRQQARRVDVFDPAEVVRDALRMLARLLGEDVTVGEHLDPAAGLVRADAGQFEQVLMNLAVNARDAMPHGGRLTVALDAVAVTAAEAPAPDAAPGGYVRLTVADTGTGMTPEVRARLFEPFFTTKPAGKGTGLGLATVYGIVHHSGGFVTVESEEGCGTAFRVYFPRHAGPPPEPAPESVRPVPPAGGGTVLVVEDDEAVRSLTTLVLERHGYRVAAAETAEEALTLCDRLPAPPDLVLTDVVMPGMNGRQLAEALWAKYPWLKVVFLSGYAEDTVGRYGIEGDRAAFLQKPYTPDSLARFVRQVLTG